MGCGVSGDYLVQCAIDRAPVRLIDGRDARLLYARRGKAKVLLPSGAVLTVDAETLEVLP